MKCGAVIVGAGQGKRLGFDLPKAFIPLGLKPVFQHSLNVFLDHPQIHEIVLVVPKEQVKAVSLGRTKVVAGGETRQASVEAGLTALDGNCDAVLVHDAARPFVTREIIDRLLAQLSLKKNCIAAWPISDTIKATKETLILKTLDRQNLWSAQTPQAFFITVLREALNKAKQDGFVGTDEASLVERLGIPVEVVLGEALNIKITTAQDLKFAQAILQEYK